MVTVVLEVELEVWTIPMLREEIAKRSDCGPKSINLICAGKLLKDGDGTQNLTQLGVKQNAKIMTTRASPDQGKSLMAEKEKVMADEERSNRLSRLKFVPFYLSIHVYVYLKVLFYNYWVIGCDWFCGGFIVQ